MEEKPLRILVVDDNPADSRLVEEMLAEVEGGGFAPLVADSLVAALDALAHGEFDIALVDLGLPDSQGLATFETIQRHAGGLPIVVFTGVSNEMLALTAVARGAQDYLVKGRMTSQGLARVLRYAMARQRNRVQHSEEEQSRAAVIGFLGVKGGVGTTSLAVNFAVAWKRQAGGKVLLIDMDTTSASSEFLLKTNSKYSILDAAANLHRLDPTFWNSVISESPSGIDVLPPPGAINFGEQLASERVRHVLRFARPLYRCIVADLTRLTPLALNLLEEIATLYAVSTIELPSFSAANRVLKKLLQTGLSREQVRLVFNRVPKIVPSPIPELEKALGYPAYAAIGDCAGELTEAYGYGRMIDEGLSFHKQVAHIAARASGTEVKIENKGIRGLLRKVLA